MLKMLLRNVPKTVALKTTRFHVPSTSHPLKRSFSKGGLSSGRCIHSAAVGEEGVSQREGNSETKRPGVVRFAENCVNSVTLTGVVMADPEENPLRNNNKVVNMNIAVPQKARMSQDIYFNTFRLSLFDTPASQALEHAQKGKKVMVQGHLLSKNQMTWVTVNEFYLLEEASWPYDIDPSLDTPTRNAPFSGSDQERLITTPMTASKNRVFDDYKNGKTIDDIVKERTLKKSTVLGYLADCAFHGYAVEFEFLTRQCLLGPKDTKYMETDAVCAVIKTIIERENVRDLEQVPQRDAHELVRKLKDGQPFQIQERLISSVTYAQLKTVLAMMKRGLTGRDWNAFKIAEVESLPEPVAPLAPY